MRTAHWARRFSVLEIDIEMKIKTYYWYLGHHLDTWCLLIICISSPSSFRFRHDSEEPRQESYMSFYLGEESGRGPVEKTYEVIDICDADSSYLDI